MLYDCRNLITKFIIFIFTVVKSAICVVFVLDISLKNWCISSINLNLCWLRDKYKYRRWQSRFTVVCTENNTIALAGMSQWIERQPVNQEVAGLISRQGICLGCGSGPQVGVCKRQQTDISLAHCLPVFLPSPFFFFIKILFIYF